MSHHIELTRKRELSDGLQYAVLLVTSNETGLQRRQLGHVESYLDTVQQMHSPRSGFGNVARKTSHPKRWRFSPTSAPGHGQRGLQRRIEAIALLLSHETDLDRRQRDELARGAKVIR